MPPITVGRAIALVVLIAAVAMLATSAIDLKVGLLIAGLAVADIVP